MSDLVTPTAAPRPYCVIISPSGVYFGPFLKPGAGYRAGLFPSYIGPSERDFGRFSGTVADFLTLICSPAMGVSTDDRWYVTEG
ncbi:MAG: hypothetical protein PVSMB7_23310 [Chloroflexota bacterium]